MSETPRTVVWFSCGVASACCLKLLADEKRPNLHAVYCDLSKDEHSDNMRFMRDVMAWTGISVTTITSDKYAGIDDVFERERYMAGIGGARCTTEMKKIPRLRWSNPDDTNVFGFTIDEHKRKEGFESRNPDLRLSWPLFDKWMNKRDCLNLVARAGIKLPAMYGLGFDHNNCIGCVKATSSHYWNQIRKHFPDVFAKRARQSRVIGCRLARHKGVRVFLDELPLESDEGQGENISCGPECGGSAT